MKHFNRNLFTEILINHRKLLNVSCRRHAKICGVSVHTIIRLESGNNPDIGTFFTICYNLSFSPSIFLK